MPRCSISPGSSRRDALAVKFSKARPARNTPSARFRPDADLFSVRKESEVYVAEVRSSPEGAVELFYELSGQMPDVVDFAVDCLRSGRRYVGESLQRSEVTEAVARLKVPLVASGGVELAVYTRDEQLCLSPMLDFWIYAKSDRWLYLLVGQGLEEAAELPARTWSVAPTEFTGAPELVDAVTQTAVRLTLKLVS